jgi:methyl-accepting chemotaxis protein
VGFGAMLVLVAVVGFIGWRSTIAFSAQSDELFRASVKAAQHLSKADDALRWMRYVPPNYLASSPEERKRMLSEEPRLIGTVTENLKEFEQTNLSSEERTLLAQFWGAFGNYTIARPPLFALIDAGKLKEAAEWRASKHTPNGVAALKALEKLVDLQQTVAVARNNEAVASARRSATLWLGVAVAVAIAVGAAFAVVIARSITRPLSDAVTSQTVRVLATSQEMAGAAEQLSRGAQEQASSLEETAASLEEMTSTGKQNTDNARQASRLALDACAVAGRGGEAVASGHPDGLETDSRHPRHHRRDRV